MQSIQPSVPLYLANVNQQVRYRHLAWRYQLPIVNYQPQQQWFLGDYGGHLALHAPKDLGYQPLSLANTDLNRRQKRYRHELLIKAVGKRSSHNNQLIDATAGWGVDSSLLAYAGWQVMAIERQSFLMALLDNYWQGKALAKRLCYWADHSQQKLGRQQAEVVYLDPMYPASAKTAKAHKHMHALQQLTQPTVDEGDLLDAACQCACRRVVVKRHRLASPLAQQRADYCYTGKNIRFDVYICG